MKKITKIFTIGSVMLFLILFGISQYKYIRVKVSPIYTTTHRSNAGVIAMGGMASDKDKIDSFKNDLEKKDTLGIYQDYINSAIAYKEKGDYEKAIKEALEALKIYPNNWTTHSVLVDLYELAGKYDLALKEYDWLILYQEKALKDSANKGYETDVGRREKIVNDLKEGHKRVEELKAKSETSPTAN